MYRVHSVGEPLASTASRPTKVLLRAVAKQNGGRGAAYCIPNELICGEIARFIQLPVPPVAVVAMPEGDPLVAALDFNFGNGPLSPANVDNCLHSFPWLSAGLLLFDIWIANADRHNGNFCIDQESSPPRMHVFDHGQALFGHVSGEAIGRMDSLTGKLGTRSCILPRITSDEHFQDWMERIESTPDFFIEGIISRARPFGLSEDEVAAASAFLKSRRDGLSGLIRDNRSAFKSIQNWRPLPF